MTGSEPAFPHMYDDGLTKRELFAAMAMQGLISSNASMGDKFDPHGVIAIGAVKMANALIAELAKEDK